MTLAVADGARVHVRDPGLGERVQDLPHRPVDLHDDVTVYVAATRKPFSPRSAGQVKGRAVGATGDRSWRSAAIGLLASGTACGSVFSRKTRLSVFPGDPDREALPGKDFDERELRRRRQHRVELLLQPRRFDLDPRAQGDRGGRRLRAVPLPGAVHTGVVDSGVLVNDLLDEEAVDVTGRERITSTSRSSCTR